MARERFQKHSMQPSVNNYFQQLRNTNYLTVFVDKVECCKKFYRFNFYGQSCCRITGVMQKMNNSLLSLALICSSPVFNLRNNKFSIINIYVLPTQSIFFLWNWEQTGWFV